jgi:hypothetical protein
MGLLVAGITGGASLINTARITSLKREADDYIRDALTFYSRAERLPGDLQNTGILGYASAQTYSDTSFSSPYNVNNIKTEVAPFIELYLYGISSFKPDPSKVNTIPFCDNTNSALPLSKAYRNIVFMYRGNATDTGNPSSYFRTGMAGKPGIELCIDDTSGKQMRDIAKKVDVKFDDGIYNGGNIRSYCNINGGSSGSVTYDAATACTEFAFYFSL